MALLRRLLPFVPGLAAALLLAVELSRPLLAPTLFLGWIVLFGVCFALVSGKEARAFSFWYLALPPLALVFGACAFLFLLESPAMSAGLVVFTGLLVAIWGHTHFLFVRQPARYQPYALEWLSLATNLAAFFLIGASVLGYVSLLSLPEWVTASVVFGTAGLLTAETLWVSKVRGDRLPGLVLIGAVLLAQTAAALLLLPVSFFVAGAALAVSYYVTVGLIRAHALAAVNRGLVRRYAIVAVTAVLFIVGTARWI